MATLRREERRALWMDPTTGRVLSLGDAQRAGTQASVLAYPVKCMPAYPPAPDGMTCAPTPAIAERMAVARAQRGVCSGGRK